MLAFFALLARKLTNLSDWKSCIGATNKRLVEPAIFRVVYSSIQLSAVCTIPCQNAPTYFHILLAVDAASPESCRVL